MSMVTFDTLAYSNRLQQGGISREHAEALAAASAEALKEVANANELATRKDLAMLKHDLEVTVERIKHDLEVTVERTKHDLEVANERTKHDIVKWVCGMMIAQTTLILTAIGVAIALLK